MSTFVPETNTSKIIHTMKISNSRRIKLSSKYREVKGEGRVMKVIPWLNVSGVWLEEAGFNAGDQVEITITNHTLTIKKLEADGNC